MAMTSRRHRASKLFSCVDAASGMGVPEVAVLDHIICLRGEPIKFVEKFE